MPPQEVAPARGLEIAPDVLMLISQGLGVSEEIALSLASVQVACPIPGEGRDSSLGEFLASEHGADKVDVILTTAKVELDAGSTPDEALHRALGFAATKDNETGRLVRVAAGVDQLKKKT